MDYAIVSEKGGRQMNEDSVAAVECDGRWLFVLADGLGGHGHGEVASAIVTDTARTVITQSAGEPGQLDELIEAVFETAQERHFERQRMESAST